MGRARLTDCGRGDKRRRGCGDRVDLGRDGGGGIAGVAVGTVATGVAVGTVVAGVAWVSIVVCGLLSALQFEDLFLQGGAGSGVGEVGDFWLLAFEEFLDGPHHQAVELLAADVDVAGFGG